jgi:hypothetical protein
MKKWSTKKINIFFFYFIKFTYKWNFINKIISKRSFLMVCALWHGKSGVIGGTPTLSYSQLKYKINLINCCVDPFYSWLNFSNRKTFSVEIFLTEKRFRLRFFWPKNVFGWDFSDRKTFPVEIFLTEKRFRSDFFNRKTIFQIQAYTKLKFF